MKSFHFTDSKTADENKSRFDDIIDELRENPGSSLIIEPGIYELSSETARNTQADVMNGVYGDNPEKTMFTPSFAYTKGLDLSGLSDVSIVANGVTLLIDGFMEPVSITECDNLTVTGLTIDHKRKPYSKGIIREVIFTDKEAGNGFMTAEFGSEYPLNENTPMPRACVFDLHGNRFSLYGEIDFDLPNRRELSPQIWQFPFSNLHENVQGNELYVWHTFHSRPAVLIENSKNTRLSCVTIHSQPGMGIVAHRCDNLYFDRLRVIPSAGEHMSTNTDATHITSCRGRVEYDRCCFDGQGDDSVNIHTYYHKIEKTGKNICRIILDGPTGTHSQTADYPVFADTLELTDIATLACLDTYKVVSCNNINACTSELILDKPLPDNSDGLYFADADCLPDFSFHDCLCRSHLARSVLTKTKRVYIENNEFLDVVGTAINVTAEAFWREGACTTQEVIIQRNRISFCGRTDSIRQSDCAGITVTLCAENPIKPVHKNVVITDNIIDCPHSPHAIYVSNTENLTLERNTVICKDEPVIVTDFGEPDL